MRRVREGVIIAVAALLCGPPATAATQERPAAVRQAQTWELLLRDGSRMYGTIEREDETELVFRTHAGATVTVKRADIASLKVVSGVMIGDEFVPPDPNATRLFFAPTGRSLPKGKAYIGVYEFLMPMLQVGVTDRLSIGGGTPLMFGFDEGDRPFWVTPKLQIFDNGRTQLAGGVFHIFGAGGEDGGIAYAVGTSGTEVGSVTIGGGLAYAGNDEAAGVVMVGGERRVRRNLKFVTENYIWKGGDGIATFGVRFIGERLSADLALVVPIGADDVLALPLVNFVYVF